MDNVADTVKHVIQKAKAFAASHAASPGIGTTFGYFTSHPVAALNHRRLALIISGISSRAAGKQLRILDVACGGGLIASACAMAGHRVLGVDIDAGEIALAREFAAFCGSAGASFETIDATNPDNFEIFEKHLGGKPDVVLLAYALHHLPDPPATLSAFASWLPPGTVLIINEENPLSPLFLLKHALRSVIQRDTAEEHQLKYSMWKKQLEAAGFAAAPPAGADPLLGSRVPLAAWSIVFTATRARA